MEVKDKTIYYEKEIPNIQTEKEFLEDGNIEIFKQQIIVSDEENIKSKLKKSQDEKRERGYFYYRKGIGYWEGLLLLITGKKGLA